MLLGMTTFFVALFYMVNFPGKSVSGFTWLMMSAAVSIFGAVLVWTVIIATVTYMVVPPPDSGHASALFRSPLRPLLSFQREGLDGGAAGPPISILVCLFLTLYAAFNLILARLWSRPGLLDIFATIGAHTLGFAAAQTVATIGETESFGASPLSYFGFCILATIVLCGLVTITTKIRQRTMDNWGISEKSLEEDEEVTALDEDGKAVMSDVEKKEHWAHICEHSENEFVAFAVGLVLTLGTQFAITGELPGWHGNPYNHTTQETGLMFVASSVYAIMLVVCIASAAHMAGHDWHRTFHMASDNISFAFGWCFLFSCRSLYWNSTDDRGFFKGDQMTARIIQAIVLSFFTFTVILLLKGAGDRGWLTSDSVRLLMGSFGLMLGLSWEGAFVQALEVVSASGGGSPDSLIMKSDILVLSVCAVILPAWALFILPNAKEAEEAMHGGHSHGDEHEGHGHDGHGEKDNATIVLGSMHGDAHKDGEAAEPGHGSMHGKDDSASS